MKKTKLTLISVAVLLALTGCSKQEVVDSKGQPVPPFTPIELPPKDVTVVPSAAKQKTVVSQQYVENWLAGTRLDKYAASKVRALLNQITTLSGTQFTIPGIGKNLDRLVFAEIVTNDEIVAGLRTYLQNNGDDNTIRQANEAFGNPFYKRYMDGAGDPETNVKLVEVFKERMPPIDEWRQNAIYKLVDRSKNKTINASIVMPVAKVLAQASGNQFTEEQWDRLNIAVRNYSLVEFAYDVRDMKNADLYELSYVFDHPAFSKQSALMAQAFDAVMATLAERIKVRIEELRDNRDVRQSVKEEPATKQQPGVTVEQAKAPTPPTTGKPLSQPPAQEPTAAAMPPKPVKAPPSGFDPMNPALVVPGQTQTLQKR